MLDRCTSVTFQVTSSSNLYTNVRGQIAEHSDIELLTHSRSEM